MQESAQYIFRELGRYKMKSDPSKKKKAMNVYYFTEDGKGKIDVEETLKLCKASARGEPLTLEFV